MVLMVQVRVVLMARVLAARAVQVLEVPMRLAVRWVRVEVAVAADVVRGGVVDRAAATSRRPRRRLPEQSPRRTVTTVSMRRRRQRAERVIRRQRS